MFRDQLERRFVTKISPDVIVVNFHSAPLIGRTIAIAHEFAGAGARLIVVDNSPGDGAADIVRSADPDAIVIANPVNRGYAAAVNQALAVADAEFVLLINPDVLIRLRKLRGRARCIQRLARGRGGHTAAE